LILLPAVTMLTAAPLTVKRPISYSIPTWQAVRIFNPAELLLAALSACIIKGIERVTPILEFELRGVEVRVHGVSQDAPPLMESIDYEIIVETDESDHRLELLHDNVRKYGTVFNTVSPGTELNGVLRRAQ